MLEVVSNVSNFELETVASIQYNLWYEATVKDGLSTEITEFIDRQMFIEMNLSLVMDRT